MRDHKDKNIDCGGQGFGLDVIRERPMMEHGPSRSEQGPVHVLSHPILVRSTGDGKLVLYSVACRIRYEVG